MIPLRMYLPRTHLRRTTHALRMVIALSTLACLGLSAPGCDAAGTAAEAWPAEPRARAQPLFIGGAWSVEGDKNWSAAHWNPATRVLYVGRDRGAIRSYSESGADAFALRSVHELDADIEGITQAWGDDDHVYAVLESEQSIVRYDLSSTVAQEIEAWDLSGLLPETDGFEGIAFVPDAALAAGGFVDRSGAVRPASLTGRDGLFFLCTQYGGDIRALDLGAAGAFEVVGVYGAPLASTRGLDPAALPDRGGPIGASVAGLDRRRGAARAGRRGRL